MYVSVKLNQLVITIDDELITTPVEEIGSVIIDHPQVKISTPAHVALIQVNASIIYCDEKHLPVGVTQPLGVNYIANKRARLQLAAKPTFNKQLWKTVVKKKIANQAAVLNHYGFNSMPLEKYARQVRSGDSSGLEGLAARYYWQYLFSEMMYNFTRDRYGIFPNNMLNYGYSILRTAVARALQGVGMMNLVGIHHHNQYNAFCLADDIMEPYRPLVDILVLEYINEFGVPETEGLTKRMKKHLLKLETYNCYWKGQKTPSSRAILRTAESLVKCYELKQVILKYPKFYAPQ